MPRWFLKAAAQKALSLLPASHSCNYLLQKHITGSIALDRPRLKSKIKYGLRHVQIWTAINPISFDGINVFELGTGWHPVLPIVFYLCGAAKIVTVDKAPLLRRENLIKTIQLFTELARDEEFFENLPSIRRDRLQSLLTLGDCAMKLPASDLLGRLNIEALIQDARDTSVESGSVQFLISNSVLQEVPQEILFGIFCEFRRIASRDSTMIHYINMVEPFVDCDPALTAYYFLQFSGSTWKYINNSLHFHNRLRIPDYRRMHGLAGFRLVSEDNEKGPDIELNAVELAAPFKHYSREDLRILRTWMVSQVQE